jgi:bifunctional non-homologous end joining protein LigD
LIIAENQIMAISRRKKNVQKGVKAAFPEKVQPMLCKQVKSVPLGNDFISEVKLDGYRIVAHLRNNEVVLRTRKGENFAERYKPVAEALKKMNINAVLDGEVIAIDEHGKHDFTFLQRYQRRHQGHLIFYVFDIIYFNGYNLTGLPLTERKEILQSAIKPNNVIKIIDIYEDGKELFEHALEFGFEGVVCKRKNSHYIPGNRGLWVKIKHKESAEYVVVGYVPSESGRFKTLLLGQYDDAGKMNYIHHSGGGYSEEDKNELFPRLKRTVVRKPPINNLQDVKLDDVPIWVKPSIVAEFQRENKAYKSGRQRHPIIFVRVREDKKPEDVIMEKSLPPAPRNVTPKREPAIEKEMKIHSGNETSGSWEEVLSRPITSRKIVSIQGRKIELVNLERKLWHDVSKQDLLNYYKAIAPFMLPYLRNRPMALNVSLNGPHAKNFFLRGLEGHYPEWAEIFTTVRKHPAKGKSPMIEWLVCNDLPTLIYLINLECIDIHPWNSRTTSPQFADYIVIDLDPTIPDTANETYRRKLSNEGFKKAIGTALAAKKFLDKHKVHSFIKTSGKSGLHIYLPCEGFEYKVQKTTGQPRTIAENICKEINALLPSITTTSFSQSTRADKVYVDPSQNDYADRVAVAYCVRATHNPTVSTPLEWQDINEKLRPEMFNINNMVNRLKMKGDVWKSLLDVQIREKNSKILQRFL